MGCEMDKHGIEQLARNLCPTFAARRLETLRAAPPIDPERADDLAQWMEKHGMTSAEAEAVCMRALALHQAKIDETARTFEREEWWPAERAIVWAQERSLLAVAEAYLRDGAAFGALFGNVPSAADDLASACREGRVKAEGAPMGLSVQRPITVAEWGAGLAFRKTSDGSLVLARPSIERGAFADIVFDRNSLWAAFEPLAERAAIRPGEYVRMTFEPDARDMLFDDVLHGRKSPAEAEAEAAAKGLEPLRVPLDPGRYDPEAETDWTLAMAVAWIAYRDLDRVRECMPAWRRDSEYWFPVDYRLPDGTRTQGHELRTSPNEHAPLAMLTRLEVWGEPGEPGQRMAINDAKAALRERLRAGQLVALTLENRALHRIAADEWAFLTFGERNTRDVLEHKGEGSFGAVRYMSLVTVSRADLVATFPADLPTEPAKAEPAPKAERPRRKTKPQQVAEIVEDLGIDPNMPEGERIRRVEAHYKSLKLPSPRRTSIQNGLRLAGRLNARKAGEAGS